MADLAFPSPALPHSWRRWTDSGCSSVGLLGLASASGTSHLTFLKTAWDSRAGPQVLAEVSFLVVNGLAFQLCTAAKAWQGSGRRSKTESAVEGGTCPLSTREETRRGQAGEPGFSGCPIPGGRSNWTATQTAQRWSIVPSSP